MTELYVRRCFRRQGIASEMPSFAENYCKSRYPIQSLELLTGEDNLAAQAVYKMMGYKKRGNSYAKADGKISFVYRADRRKGAVLYVLTPQQG